MNATTYIDNSALATTTVPKNAAVSEAIDLESYVPRFCTYLVDKVLRHQFWVVLALPAIGHGWHKDLPSVDSPTPPNVLEQAAREARQCY